MNLVIFCCLVLISSLAEGEVPNRALPKPLVDIDRYAQAVIYICSACEMSRRPDIEQFVVDDATDFNIRVKFVGEKL